MELKSKLEHRELWQPSQIIFREGEDGEQVIEGDAIMCNVETILYEDDNVREIEVIDPSCITPEFINAQNMFINAIHDRGKTFGRQGAKLNVIPREDRVSFNCKGTSQCFAETRALINDGVYTGCSFEFWSKNYDLTEREGADKKTEYVIRHTQFKAIGALTVAMQPAYKQTSVNARELYRELHPTTPTPEELEARRQEEATRAREAREQQIKLQTAQRERDLFLMTL